MYEIGARLKAKSEPTCAAAPSAETNHILWYALICSRCTYLISDVIQNLEQLTILISNVTLIFIFVVMKWHFGWIHVAKFKKVPCHTWPTPEEKVDIIANFKKGLKTKKCKYFDPEEGTRKGLHYVLNLTNNQDARFGTSSFLYIFDVEFANICIFFVNY